MTITPVDDNLLEGDETIGLRGATPGLTVVGTTLTLADDEEVPAVSLAVSRDRIVESDGAVTVTVSATLDPDVAMANEVTTVELELMGSATRDTDYTRTWSPSPPAISIPLNATLGSNTVTLTLTPQQDEVAEGDETIVVEGTATTGSRSLVVRVADITLQDDDVRGVVVTPTRLEVDEGSSGQYTVRLTAEPLSDVTVSVGVPGGASLEASPGVLTFTPSTWREPQTVTVTVEDDADAVMHADVELTHAVGGGGYDGVTAASVAVTLAETTVPQMRIEAGGAEESAGLMTFAVTLDVESSEEVQAAWATAGVTAAAGADYTESSGTVVFPAGVTAQTVVVPILPDDLDEEHETFTVTLSGERHAALAVSEATGTITDDDDEPALTLSAPAAAAQEGTDTSLVFTVTLAPASGREVTVRYATLDGTATAPDDYAATTGTLTFGVGQTSGTVAVAVVDDGVDEDEAEDFTLTLRSPSNALFAGDAETLTATGTIEDDDDPAVGVSFGAAAYTAAEGGSAVMVTVSLDVDPEREVTIPLTAANEAGATDGDYSGVPAEVVFTAGGALFRTFGVTAVDDAVDDDGERVALGFGTALPAGVTASGTTAAVVTLTDDDERGVTASQTAVSVDEDSSTSYTVVLTSEPTAEVTVTVSGTSGTDLTAPVENLALSFTPENWREPQTVTVTAADDTDVLADAPVVLAHVVRGGDYGSNAVAGPAVTVTIIENDTATVSVTDASASEPAGHVVFTVTLSEESSASVTLDYSTTDVTAASPGDYTSTSGTLTFTAPETERTIQVPVVDDTLDEEEAETFSLTLSNVAQAGFAGGASTLAATGTIEDDDDPAVAVSFGSAAYTAAEGGSPVTVTVSLDRDPERAVTVPLTAAAGRWTTTRGCRPRWCSRRAGR